MKSKRGEKMVKLDKTKFAIFLVLFAGLVLLTVAAAPMLGLSIYLPISGNEYHVGDQISFKDELAGRIIIPAAVGDCDDEFYDEGPCYRFNAASFLQDDLIMEIVAIDPVVDPNNPTLVTIRCGNAPRPEGVGYGITNGQQYSISNGKVVAPQGGAPGYIPVFGDCPIISGTKSGKTDGGPYTQEFIVTSQSYFSGAEADGYRIFINDVEPTDDTTHLDVEMAIVVRAIDPTSSMWVLDACVASPDIPCGSDEGGLQPPDDDDDNGIPDVIDDIIDDVEDTYDDIAQDLNFNLFAVLLSGIVSAVASGFLKL